MRDANSISHELDCIQLSFARLSSYVMVFGGRRVFCLRYSTLLVQFYNLVRGVVINLFDPSSVLHHLFAYFIHTNNSA